MRPNILWICTDQQRYDTIGALNNPYVQTPNIDRLVREGVTFTHAYCQSPICTPSRASFLTGTHPTRTRNTRNGNDAVAPGHPPLVTKLLADVGYDCGLIGKLHLSSAYRRIERRTDDGYRYWQYSHAPRDDWATGHDYADWVRAQGYSLKELNKSPDGVPAELHQTTWCARKTIDFLREQRDGRPWLASVNIYDPHPPFNPPATHRARFDPAQMPGPLFRESDIAQQEALAAIDFQSKVRNPRELDIKSPLIPASPLHTDWQSAETPGNRDARTLQAAYYAMIALIDDAVGAMVAALEETGQRENTVIIFTSDHGETLGDHGLIEKGCRFYEGLVRVPLIWSWPGHFPAGVVSDALVELTDKAPTLLALAGEPIPAHMQGKSLLPILTGAASPAEHRTSVRSEYFDALLEPDASRATMLRNRRYKLMVYHGHGLGELYDLQEDPGEFVNLWDDPAHQSVKMALLVESFDGLAAAVDVGTERIGPM
jgi:arylsulfatase